MRLYLCFLGVAALLTGSFVLGSVFHSARSLPATPVPSTTPTSQVPWYCGPGQRWARLLSSEVV